MLLASENRYHILCTFAFQVNARYLDKDYTASMHVKNDFILVAEYMGHVVGFIQYYFQKFTPQPSGPRSPRQNPRPVLYVATLQTASMKSHPEYCQQCTGAIAKSGNASAELFAASHFSGAEPRTGVLLMALVLAHGAQDRKELALIDSTIEAVPFYRRFFGMQCSSPVSTRRARSIEDFRTPLIMDSPLVCV